MITPIILSGGNGTRLWPLSRKSKPKQFIELINNNTLFTETIQRFNNKDIFNEPIILGNVNHVSLIDEEIKKNNLNESLVLLEPEARNTAPAIAAIVSYLKNKGREDDMVIFLPSDAYINNTEKFVDYIMEGEELARDDKIICFGIQPTYPETGYGYIQLDKKINNNSYYVKKFTEKPNLETAMRFFNDKNYLWNAGIFMAKISTLYNLFINLQKELFESVELAISNSKVENNFIYINKDYFSKAEEISIDYAIIENMDFNDLCTISMNILWSDVGSYKSLFEINPNKTLEKNIISNDVITHNVENCYLRSKDKTIVCSDIDDLIVVEEDDIILVMKKDKSQNIKKLIEKIKEKNLKHLL